MSLGMISRINDRATLIAALHAHLLEATHASALQLMWQADGVLQSLFATEATLRMPAPPEWLQLTAGQIAEGGNTTYIPLLVLGELRGWLALQGGDVDGSVPDLATHAALALALLERQNYQTIAARELALMDKIGRMLSTTLRLDQLLANLGHVVRELMVADDFYIALLDESTDELFFAYLSSQQAQQLPAARWPKDAGLTGQVMRSSKPIVTDDYLAECERRQIVPVRPVELTYSRAWLGVPLCHHDRVLGVMVAGINDSDRRYTEADVHLMSSVAAQAAAAVANAQLYNRVEQQANQLAVINRIGRTISATLDPQEVPMLIMQELKKTLDVADGAVLIEDPATNELVVRYTLEPSPALRLPRGAGLAGEALRWERVQIVNAMQQHLHVYPPLDLDGPIQTTSLICAPLTGRQQLRGVIQLRNKRNGPFTLADAQLLEAVAEQAAVALENAELYAHTDNALAAHIADLEQRNHQLTNIVAISNTLRATSDMHELGRHIITTIQQITGSPRVVVGLVEAERQYVRAVAQIGLNPGFITSRRDLWTPVAAVRDLLGSAQQIGTVTYHIGRHPLTATIDDCVVLTLLDPAGELVGTIALDQADCPSPFSTALIHELDIIANQVAVAVVNARLASEQQQTVDRLTALNALSLAVTTSQLSTDEILQMTLRGAIGTTNGLGGGWCVQGRDDTQRRMALDVPAGCDAQLLPLLQAISEDYIELEATNIPASLREQGVQSVLIVPVRGAKLTLGGMWIGYTEPGVVAGEREMVVLYAKTAGAVLENLRLFDQVSAAHDRLASILASTADGMLMATAQGRIAAANTSLLHLLGFPNESLEGRTIHSMCEHPVLAHDYKEFEPICAALHAVAQGASAERNGEANLTTPNLRDLAWSVLPVRGATDQQTAALLVLRDVTAERQTEKLRQDLANMIVHDLRAPLTNMMVSIDLLLKQISGPLTAAQQRIIQIAGDSSQQMLDLVNALLDIRRLEQRQLEIRRQPVELFELVEGVFERLARVAEDRRVQLVNTTASVPPMSVDLDLVRRVLQNLIDNATKFSPRGSRVEVRGCAASIDELPVGHTDGRWLLVEITDQGQGVPESYRSVIFELFGQAPQGRGQGTGLGLAFCKLAVAAHGGMIWVDDALDGGAVFRFTVPLA